MKIRSLIVASLLTVGGALAFAAPASAAEPTDTERTLSVSVVDREDSGTGTPTVWAKDTFDRKLTIKAEVVLSQDDEVKAATVTPGEQLCDLVEKNELAWKYEMTGIDRGTFKTTNDSATGSPGEHKPLTKNATGNFEGGFKATFTAPAFWCSYEPETSADDRAKTGSSGYPELLFGDGVNGVEMPAWQWTYTRCTNAKYTTASAEKWINGIDGNPGDILGKPCELKPVPTTPAATPTTGGTALPTLPLTGEGGGTNWGAVIGIVGGSIVVVGTALVLMTRKRRFAA